MLSFLIFSCGSELNERYVCDCKENKLVSAFIERNIHSSNNMSDEEMEDVILELFRTSVKTHCHQELVWVSKTDPYEVDWGKQKKDSCSTVHSNIF